MRKKKVTIFFLGDVKYDSRVLKMVKTLADNHFYVKIYSFFNFLINPQIISDTTKKDDYLKSNNIEITYIKLPFKKKIPFINFYLKSIILSLKNKTDYILCPDIFSLPIAFLISFFSRVKYFYDSRELFSNLASLHKKKYKQLFWILVENISIKKCSGIITVNDSIARILNDKFKTKDINVIFNFPSLLLNKNAINIIDKIPVDPSRKILLYQGGLQAGRGITILLEIIPFLEECFLLFLGMGNLKKIIKSHSLYNKRIFLIENIPASEILRYTSNGYLGMSLIENLGKSYYLSLPNKIFEYCHAGVPVIASNFPEIRKFIEKYNIGEVVDPENYQNIIDKIKYLIENPNIYLNYKNNCLNARTILNWESQETKFIQIFR